MERTSQVLAMRAPASDWTGPARRLGQPFGERATNADTHDRFVADSFILGGIIVAATRAAAAIARRARARHRQRRQARAIYNAFRHLDDRTLRDLGFDCSEITSIAAEVTGEAECTRVRALLTSHGLPR